MNPGGISPRAATFPSRARTSARVCRVARKQVGEGLARASQVGRGLEQRGASAPALGEADELAIAVVDQLVGPETGPAREASGEAGGVAAVARLERRDGAQTGRAGIAERGEQAVCEPTVGLGEVVNDPRVAGGQDDVEHQVVGVADHRTAPSSRRTSGWRALR